VHGEDFLGECHAAAMRRARGEWCEGGFGAVG
jgi:hypothetical protein